MTEEQEYRVDWSIELTAESAQDAAEQALGIQRDPYGRAVVFLVTDGIHVSERVDLEKVPGMVKERAHEHVWVFNENMGDVSNYECTDPTCDAQCQIVEDDTGVTETIFEPTRTAVREEKE